jgi:hypothetical protein
LSKIQCKRQQDASSSKTNPKGPHARTDSIIRLAHSSMCDRMPENDTSIPLTVYGSSTYFVPLVGQNKSPDSTIWIVDWALTNDLLKKRQTEEFVCTLQQVQTTAN